jgi:hypothetical protein
MCFFLNIYIYIHKHTLYIYIRANQPILKSIHLSNKGLPSFQVMDTSTSIRKIATFRPVRPQGVSNIFYVVTPITNHLEVMLHHSIIIPVIGESTQ